MEELLAWLKDTRLLLASHLPDSYDDLQVELQKCEVRRGRVTLFGWLLRDECTRFIVWIRFFLFPVGHLTWSLTSKVFLEKLLCTWPLV